jgi:NIPSNAP protein
MTLSRLFIAAVILLSLAAGSLVAPRLTHAESDGSPSGRVFELRVYHTLPGRLPQLLATFRDHNVAYLKKHGMTSIGYWTPQDAPASENTLIFIVAHESREAADRNWKEFRADPEWQKLAKASLAGGEIVEKIDSTFMTPTDYSALK